MKIVIATLMYKRHNVFRLFAENFLHLKKKSEPYGIDLECVCVGSDGKEGERLCAKYGIYYTNYPNKPLGRKANHRLELAKALNPDYVIFLGSDDLMSFSDLMLKKKYIDKGFNFIAPMDIYYYDLNTNKRAYSRGYQGTRRAGEPMAVGRCLSASILDQMNWRMFSDGINRGLDNSAKKRLAKVKNKRKKFYWHSIEGTCIFDVKSNVNLNSFNKMRRLHKPDFTNKFAKNFQHLKL